MRYDYDIPLEDYSKFENSNSTRSSAMSMKKSSSSRGCCHNKVVRGIIITLAVLLVIFLTLVIVIISRTFYVTSKSETEQKSLSSNIGSLSQRSQNNTPKLTDAMIKRFSNALRFHTVSYENAEVWKEKSESAFEEFANYIHTSFPSVHSSPLVLSERVNNYSLLYIVKGNDFKDVLQDVALAPLFIGHLDVVPVDGQVWTVDPFEGLTRQEKDPSGNLQTFVYGRGSIDDKQTVFGLLESLEHILQQPNFQPKRTIILAFGHDEELGGHKGAASIRRRLNEMGIKRVDFILDEGSMVLDKVLPTVNKPVALISTAEKGSATVRVSVTVPATKIGHSSMPNPDSSAIVILSQALVRLRDNPMPNYLDSEIDRKNGASQLLYVLLPQLPFYMRIIIANQWMFRSLLSSKLSEVPSVDASIRTTTAFTQLMAGVKSNVIPQTAAAIINHRIHPSDSVESVLKHYHKYVVSGPHKDYINVTVVPGSESVASPISSSTNRAYRLLQAVLKTVFPEALIASNILVANTDSRQYISMTDSVYRFCPTHMHMNDLKRFHGPDERISLNSYQQSVKFYYYLLANMDDFEVLSQPNKAKLEF